MARLLFKEEVNVYEHYKTREIHGGVAVQYYKITHQGSRDAHPETLWASSIRAAEAIERTFKAAGYSMVIRMPVDVPTDRWGLLAFLNNM